MSAVFDSLRVDEILNTLDANEHSRPQVKVCVCVYSV